MRIVKLLIDYLEYPNATGNATGPFSFTAATRATNSNHSYPPIDVRGRGTAGPRVLLSDFAGSGTVTGKVQGAGFPYPTQVKYAQGTLRCVYHFDASGQTPTHYMDVPVAIHNLSFVDNEKTGDDWDVTFTWVANGTPSITWGSGTQKTVNTPNAADYETYEGCSKTYDPNDLISSASQRFVCEGISDSDAAELAKLVAKVAAATTPMSNLKVYTGDMVQRISSTAMAITLRWVKKDSKDEVQIPSTFTITDPNNMISMASRALVDATPSTPSGFSVRSSRAQDLVSPDLGTTHKLYTLEYGLRTTIDDVQMPGTWTWTDPSDLKSEGIKTTVYATAGGVPSDPSPPSGLQIVNARIVQENTVNSRKEWQFGKDTSAQEWVNARNYTLADPSNLASTQIKSAIDTTAALDAGFVDRGVRSAYITHDHIGTLHEGGLRSTSDDIQMPGTWNRVDPSDLESEGIKTTVYAAGGGVPSDPTPPSGQSIVFSRVTQENTINSKKEWWFGKDTSAQKVINEHTSLVTDPGSIASTQTTAALDGSAPALNAGFQDRGTRQISITHDHTLSVREGGLRSTVDDIEMGGTEAIRTFASPFENRIVTVSNDTRAANVIADANLTSFFSEANSAEMRVRKENHTRAVTTKIYRGAIGLSTAYLLLSRVTGTRIVSEFRLSGGNVQVYVAQKWTLNSTWTRVLLAKRRLLYLTREISILRNFNAASVPDYPSYIESTNTGSFLGLSAGTVMYMGAEDRVMLSTGASTQSMDVGYLFKTSNLGFCKLDGWREVVDVNVVSSGITSGDWNDVSALTGSGLSVADAIPTNDFSVFLAAYP